MWLQWDRLQVLNGEEYHTTHPPCSSTQLNGFHCMTVLTGMKMIRIFVLSCPSVPCCFFQWKFAFLLMIRWCSVSHYFCVKKANYYIYLWSSHQGLLMTAGGDQFYWELTDAVRFLVQISAIMNTGWSGATCFRCNFTRQEMVLTVHFHCISYLLIHSHIYILTLFEPWEQQPSH